ncbi:hypothetical protein ACWC98_11595 [Streptomyces goshikiensis]|uniref:hypothetical protein n=1 Tax=Streptomyces goshikiensis TaxID=1942 RepID=UPI003687A69A
METAPFLLRSRWGKALETILLDARVFAWGPRIRLSREQPGHNHEAGQVILSGPPPRARSWVRAA